MPKAEKTVVPKTFEVRRTKRNLKCRFTDAEILQLGRDLAESTERYSQVEADKKQMTKEFDAKLAEAEAATRSASGKIQSGYEYRNIDCTETLGEPDDNKKTVRRTDLNEIVEVRELNEEEKQRLMDFRDDQPADAAKIAELLPKAAQKPEENLDVPTP